MRPRCVARSFDSPPPVWRFLVRLIAPSQERDAIDGDLLERYRHDLHVRRRDLSPARMSYRRQVVRSLLPLLVCRLDVRRVALFATTISVAVAAFGFASFAIGGGVETLGFDQKTSLAVHLVITLPLVGLMSAAASRLSPVGPLVTAGFYSLLLVTPALAGPWASELGGPWAPELTALRVMWIMLVPLVALACGGWPERWAAAGPDRRAVPGPTAAGLEPLTRDVDG